MLEKIFPQSEFDRRFPKAPAWRQDAFKAFQKLPLPSPKEEAWRYTDLNGVDFPDFTASKDVKPAVKAENAHVAKADADERFGPDSDKMEAWTLAFGNAIEIDVEPGKSARLESNVHLEHSGALLQIVRIGAGAHLDFFEHYTSAPSGILFGQHTVFDVAENARLRYFAAQRFGNRTRSFAHKEFRLSEDAQLTCWHADVGARMSRTAVSHRFKGRNASAPEHSAVFFGSGNQHFDLSTVALHQGVGTQSNILVKGALKDKASSVYRGRIQIDANARQTDSYLQDRVLHLNKGVKSNSIPSLFIDNNDVKASHGATVSRLNDDSLFYLRSRGLSRPKAEELIVQGFLADVVRRLPHEGLKKSLINDIERKISQ